MSDKKEYPNIFIKTLLVVSVLIFLVGGGYGLAKSFQESAKTSELAEIASEQKYERRLAAVANELGLETKYVLFDGRDTWDSEKHFYKTDRKEYIVVFDEKDQIQTIIEEKEED